MKLSVILPTYNESENIEALLEAIINNIPAGYDYEIVVVDDNSPDHTFARVKERFAEDTKVNAILRESDHGLAKSIRTGLEAATGDQVLVMDSDFTHDPRIIPTMLHIAEIYDIVSGSRFCAGGNMQNRTRYLLSLIYNWLIRLLLRTQIQDNLGGYFTMSMARIRQLPFDEIFFGYGDYYFRLLHFAQVLGMTIVEIPCYYSERKSGYSKTRFVRTLAQYSIAVIRCKMTVRRYRGMV